jgi:serine/threonine protein kinase
MGTEKDKIRNTFADQLERFDDMLQPEANDVDMLAEIQKGIGSLLASGVSSEADIRLILQQRYDSGRLRKETFQQIKTIIDRYAIERSPTGPVPKEPVPEPKNLRESETSEGDDAFGSTTVIPTDLLPVADSADSRVQAGSILRDRFLLQEKISGGSMGVVYKALDRRLAEAGAEQTSVAIKVLSPQLAENGHALRALQQEAAKTRCLVHPHIVRFIDLDRDDDLYFLILEWLEGRTLADILDSADARSIDIDAAFRIVRQIGEALDYAHRCGIVHADIKPANIMMMPDGNAKLFDFGVARVQQARGDGEFDPGVLGALTPAYSSMQVLGGEEPVAADDVFSLGCLLYRLVAGYRVFGPRNAAEASQEGMRPQRPQGLNDAQWIALKKALSYSRVTRFTSVKDFIGALDEVGDQAVNVEAPERIVVEDDSGSPGMWIAMIVILIGLAGIGAQRLGYLDPWLHDLLGSTEFIDAEEQPEFVIEEMDPEAIPEIIIGEEATDFEPPENIEQPVVESQETEPEIRNDSLLDYSELPPPMEIVRFSLNADAGEPTKVVLREDGDPVIVDFIREGGADAPLTLRLEEVGFSGNRSPWATGQYALSNSGLVVFPEGQERARVTLRAASDPRREADQQSTLRLRLADSAESELATLSLTLEDDDQRAFEAELPANTIAFAVGQASISEADPAVQIDLVRFNPDDTSVEIDYTVADITATEGADYFAPGTYSILFGPGQRSARLLIPLVQDSNAEGNEAFVVEIVGDPESRSVDVFQRIVVMIRDDEPPAL